MLFTSLLFLFLFLPCILVLYYGFTGKRSVQNIILLLGSLFFYAWGEPSFVIVLLVSIIFNWLVAILIERSTSVYHRKALLAFSVLMNIGLLFVFKYLYFFASQVEIICGIQLGIRAIALPIGISFFTFQALSYCFDVYRGEKCQSNLLNVALYISFFPQLIAGPIVRYNAIARQIMHRQESITGFSAGIGRFIQGFAKKVLIANSMAVIADKAFSMESAALTTSFAWLGAFAYTMQIYFDFSGYSDMAIGLGKMFGFTFEENFNHPYGATSITDFWRRWHISLSRWFRDYVYIPLGGNRNGHLFRNLLVVWLLTGIWHGANWTFVIWGLAYFCFLYAEKICRLDAIFSKKPLLGHLYTMTLVTLLWVIFRAENITAAVIYLQSMFGLGSSVMHSGLTVVYFKENIFYIVFAILLSTELLPKQLCKPELIANAQLCAIVQISYILCLIGIFVVSIAYLINGVYNPFIYFHF